MAKSKVRTFPASALMGSIIAVTNNTSFSGCNSLDSSMVSSVTLDDSLRSSERFQYRFDPRLESLKEQKWAVSSWGHLEEEELRLAPYGENSKNRFLFTSSSIIDDALLEGTTTVDTALCAKPQRKPSIKYHMSSSSASLSFHHLLASSACSSASAANFVLEEEILSNDYFDAGNDHDEHSISVHDLWSVMVCSEECLSMTKAHKTRAWTSNWY